MIHSEIASNVLEGLKRDTLTGDYRVVPGYEYQAHRYRIHESWLDEDDNLWIAAVAVEREQKKAESEEG
jgi:hypothetical protein